MRLARLVVTLCAALLAATAFAQDVPLFKLVARDGKFEPSVLEVPAGKRVRVEVTNENKKAIAPGASATFTLNPLKPGEYKFFDEFQQSTGQGRIVAK